MPGFKDYRIKTFLALFLNEFEQSPLLNFLILFSKLEHPINLRVLWRFLKRLRLVKNFTLLKLGGHVYFYEAVILQQMLLLLQDLETVPS